MAIGRNESGDFFDSTLKAQRFIPVDLSGNEYLISGATAPVAHVETITRYATAGTRTVGAGNRSYSVAVVSAASVASPTLGGVALPVGYAAEFTAPQADTVTGLSLVTVTGDDVIVTVVP
jgi:hypothetical protein